MIAGTVSLVISGLALVVSCFAATVSWRAYRQAGARVMADLDIREPMRVADGTVVAGSVHLSISNKGLAAVGINHAIWIIVMSNKTLVALVTAGDDGIGPINGTEFPITLSGLHSVDWEFDFDKLVDLVESGDAKVRVNVSLGDREVSTPWCRLPGKDSVAFC